MDPITVTLPTVVWEMVVESITTHSATIRRDSRLPHLEAEWSHSLRSKAELLEELALVLTVILETEAHRG